MNLQQLNSALPKKWLEISCNKITCNEVVVPPQVNNTQLFQCIQSVASPAVGSTTVICDTAQIVNPNFNIVTNTYTAPMSQNMQVSLSGLTALGVTPGIVSPTLVLTVNGADVPAGSSTTNLNLPAFGNISLCINKIVTLNAGDVLGLRVTNIVTPGLNTQFFNFSGVVV